VCIEPIGVGGALMRKSRRKLHDLVRQFGLGYPRVGNLTDYLANHVRNRHAHFIGHSARRLCDTISPPPRDPSAHLRPGRSRRPNYFEPWRNSARRLCDTTSPPPPDPSPRLRPGRSDDRVPPGTLRPLLLPSPSLPQSVFDRRWFVARPIERQRHSTPTEA